MDKKRKLLRPGAGKNKGSQYEREVGVKLSLWISKGERKDLMCRTVGSGGQFTWKNCGHAGDLMPQDPLAQQLCDAFVIECKFWRDLELIKFLSGKGLLFDAMEKVKEEAKKTGKKWWLIAKQNRQDDLLICAPSIIIKDHLRYVTDDLSSYPKYHDIFCNHKQGIVRIFYLDDFIDKIIPENFLL